MRGSDGRVTLRVELRDGRASWFAPPTGTEGELVMVGNGVSVRTGPAAPLALVPLPSATDSVPVQVIDRAPVEFELRARGGRVRGFKRVDGLLRVGDAKNFPVARVRREGDGGPGEALLYDAGGVLSARATVSGGRIAVTNREGRVLAFVVGLDDPERAVLLFLPSALPGGLPNLSPSEQALLIAAPILS